MVTETQVNDRVTRIQALLEEYADCRDELSSRKIAIEIDSLYKEDAESVARA